jgi:hypothetical protein
MTAPHSPSNFLEKYLGVRWFWLAIWEGRATAEHDHAGSHRRGAKPDFLWRNRGPAGALWGASSGPTEMHARALFMGITPEHQREVRLWERHNKWGG